MYEAYLRELIQMLFTKHYILLVLKSATCFSTRLLLLVCGRISDSCHLVLVVCVDRVNV